MSDDKPASKPAKQTAKIIHFPRDTEAWFVCPDCGSMSYGLLRANFPDGTSGVRICCEGSLADGEDCEWDILVQMIIGIPYDDLL